MNDVEFQKKLQAARVPERPATYWDDFPRQVSASLRKDPAARVSQPHWRPRLAWGFGLAFACLTIGFVIGNWRERNRADSFSWLQNEAAVQKILAMFPNRVRAIEQDDQGVRLVLSENPDVPTSTPLWIKICDGPKCRVVITFSGQELQIAKEPVEVLADAQGQVMLVGNRLCWSSAAPSRVNDHLRIQARPLTEVM